MKLWNPCYHCRAAMLPLVVQGGTTYPVNRNGDAKNYACDFHVQTQSFDYTHFFKAVAEQKIQFPPPVVRLWKCEKSMTQIHPHTTFAATTWTPHSPLLGWSCFGPELRSTSSTGHNLVSWPWGTSAAFATRTKKATWQGTGQKGHQSISGNSNAIPFGIPFKVTSDVQASFGWWFPIFFWWILPTRQSKMTDDIGWIPC